MVLVPKWLFFQLSLLGNIEQENVFYDILERKNAFLGYKNKKFKQSKVWHFPKMAIFPTFLFGKQENVFYDILERKNAFLGYKNKKFKTLKNWHLAKGVNPWFWSKNGRFSNFYFLASIEQKKCLLRYFRTKKRLSRL